MAKWNQFSHDGPIVPVKTVYQCHPNWAGHRQRDSRRLSVCWTRGMSFLFNCCKKVTFAYRHGMCSDRLHVFGKVKSLTFNASEVLAWYQQLRYRYQQLRYLQSHNLWRSVPASNAVVAWYLGENLMKFGKNEMEFPKNEGMKW